MSEEHTGDLEPRTQEAIEQLKATISKVYPSASFAVARDPEEPENIHLVTTVDLDDPDEVLDLVIDRLLDLQVVERIPVHVIPVRTPDRILASLGQAPRPYRRLHRAVSSVG